MILNFTKQMFIFRKGLKVPRLLLFLFILFYFFFFRLFAGKFIETDVIDAFNSTAMCLEDLFQTYMSSVLLKGHWQIV